MATRSISALAADNSEIARRVVRPEECALIVVDIQEKLLPPICEKERLLNHAQLLVRLAGILEIPVVATTPYARGLGETVADVKSLLPSAAIDKQSFSCFGSDAFCSAMKRLPGQRNTMLLCGMESHICVAQTALAA
jgi:nicotinamidase-related amidase